MTEYAPRAVVESPFLISQKMVFHGQTLGLRDRAGRRILHFIKRTRKAVGIVDCFWPGDIQHVAAAPDPGRRNHTHGLWLRQFLSNLPESKRKRVLLERTPFEPRPSRFLLGNRIG